MLLPELKVTGNLRYCLGGAEPVLVRRGAVAGHVGAFRPAVPPVVELRQELVVGLWSRHTHTGLLRLN